MVAADDIASRAVETTSSGRTPPQKCEDRVPRYGDNQRQERAHPSDLLGSGAMQLSGRTTCGTIRMNLEAAPTLLPLLFVLAVPVYPEFRDLLPRFGQP